MSKKMGEFFGCMFLLVVLSLPVSALYFRVSGDLSVCRMYYPEMGLAQCYFSSKTVRVPGGSK